MKIKSLFHRLTARWRYNPLWMRLLHLTGKELKDKKWIFITGCYNSGTTLLHQILSSHPQISGLPDEGVMLTDQLVRPEDFGWRRMWSECEELMESSPRNQARNAEIIKKHWSHFYDGNKSHFLEKSISNTTRLNFLKEHFQPAFFIHIVRNGYAVAEGIYRKAEVMPGNPYAEHGRYPISVCAKQWVRSLELFEQTYEGLPNVIEVKYESLAEDPSAVVNEILEKLGLERFPEEFFSSAFSVHEKKSVVRNMNSASFKRLKKEDYNTINEVAGEYLAKYGYNQL